MKDAKSMYRGGDIVEAQHCDFNSAKLLGLVCPFCNEAVYLRAGTSRTGKSKISLVNPSFCHYPGSAEDLDCERRSMSGEGRREIERIKTEKRGQRLELYNKHLWDMVVRADIIPRLKLDARFLRKNRSIIYRWMPSGFRSVSHAIKSIFTIDEIRRFLYEAMTIEFEPENVRNDGVLIMDSWGLESFNIDAKHQQSICFEVVDWLSSRTSGYTFESFLVWAATLHKDILECSYYRDEPDHAIEIPAEKLTATAFADGVVNSFASFCYPMKCTPWEAQIERFSNPDRKAADEKYYALLEQAKQAAQAKD